MRKGVCMCVCVCQREREMSEKGCVYVGVCLCLSEREREREMSEKGCVFVCVYHRLFRLVIWLLDNPIHPRFNDSNDVSSLRQQFCFLH